MMLVLPVTCLLLCVSVHTAHNESVSENESIQMTSTRPNYTAVTQNEHGALQHNMTKTSVGNESVSKNDSTQMTPTRSTTTAVTQHEHKTPQHNMTKTSVGNVEGSSAIITSYNIDVCEGGTVYLNCTLPKQRWAFKPSSESQKVFISTRFKNGTVIKERPDPDSRFTHTLNHLQILNIQQMDSGTYFCSGKDIAVVSVSSESNTMQCPVTESVSKNDSTQMTPTRSTTTAVTQHEHKTPQHNMTKTSVGNVEGSSAIITGYNIDVCEGGTVYLKCTLPKQRWAFKPSSESKKVFISTRFKNGTVIKERPDPDSRFTHTLNHLQILNIQQMDSGTYFCSGKDIAVVSVSSESNTMQCPVTAETTESGNNIPQKSANVVLIVVLSVCVLAVVTVVLLSVIVCLKFSGRKRLTASKPEESVLHHQNTVDADRVRLQSADRLRSYNDEIHYASLGQNWRARGCNQQSRQQVIYSTLLLTPKHTPTHTP
ncbi:uncharacterized protein LOC113658463 [Tachysurus fulvidraco]|uniref:uncharacterized protein LOC113658463 n=1 Tax=Tachysurus fulvidraco TaxID=1234273 RepID=UPI001FEF15D1|nr:uncharacterized protein LOC113658463 [Tachysurus fulvidraco]